MTHCQECFPLGPNSSQPVLRISAKALLSHHFGHLPSTVMGAPAGGAGPGWAVLGLHLGHTMSKVPVDFQLGLSSSSWRTTAGYSGKELAASWGTGTNTPLTSHVPGEAGAQSSLFPEASLERSGRAPLPPPPPRGYLLFHSPSADCTACL